jgi:YD repeat-containing protein
MDRRQLLFGATALGLVTNLSLNHPLIAQVGKVIGRGGLSDRERAGLRGPVKTCIDFMEDVEAESMCAEYGTDGRLLVCRYISNGSRVEQVYSYDGMGRLIGVTDGGADGTDEFHYDEQGKKTRVRTVPPRPDRQNSAWEVTGLFEATEEGFCLNYGGPHTMTSLPSGKTPTPTSPS